VAHSLRQRGRRVGRGLGEHWRMWGEGSARVRNGQMGVVRGGNAKMRQKGGGGGEGEP
jgi:hypothetical protein